LIWEGEWWGDRLQWVIGGEKECGGWMCFQGHILSLNCQYSNYRNGIIDDYKNWKDVHFSGLIDVAEIVGIVLCSQRFNWMSEHFSNCYLFIWSSADFYELFITHRKKI
jgi:hypothetical protein